MENLNIERYLKIVNAENFDWFLDIFPMIDTIYINRPEVDVTIDQSKCTLTTILKKVQLMFKETSFLNGSILCIGDGDLISVACCFFNMYIFEGKSHSFSITVVDRDIRILQYIGTITKAYHFPITCITHNLIDPVPENIEGVFDGMMSDPPYTINGIELFLSRGITCLKKEPYKSVYLSFGRKPVEELLEIQKIIITSGMIIDSIEKQFNTYEGAQIIGGISDLYYLKTTSILESNVKGKYTKKIYTHELNPRVRKYQCTTCKTYYRVGNKQKYTTIEELKKKRCPKCLGNTFLLSKS